MKRKPPAIAAWLLEHFSSNVALIGDLNEEYQHGRSFAWYWSQVFATIINKVYEDVRFHPVVVVRGVAFGWVLMLVTRYVFERLIRFLFDAYQTELLLEAHKSQILFFLLGPPALLWVILFTVPCLIVALLVARLHQRECVAVVLLFAASVLVVGLWNLPWILTLTANSWSNSRYLPYLVTHLVELTLPPLLIVLGGLYGRSSEARTASQEQSPSNQR
jgi:hypothetical protein